MYCEVYIDVMFLANFMMDSLVLLSVKGLMKKRGNTGRVFVAGAVGAGVSCVLMTWLPMGWPQFLVLHLLAGPAMLWMGIQLDGLGEFLRAYILLYFVSILFGGVLGMLKPYVKSGSLYFGTAVACFYGIRIIWSFLSKLQEYQQNICYVTLYTEKKSCTVQALWDTGNVLTDPRSKRPVCVLEKRAALRLLDQTEARDEIPYHTIGGHGMMPVYELKKMYIEQECKFWIEHPLVGICEEQLSEQGRYQMIINPEIIGGKENGCKSRNAAAV